jgi:archaeal flagellar protein FlaI
LKEKRDAALKKDKDNFFQEKNKKLLVEKTIQRILDENRKKIEKRNRERIKPEHFTLDKTKPHLFYVEEDDEDKKKKKSKYISQDIMNDARQKLGEEPLDEWDEPEENKGETKKKLRFGRQKRIDPFSDNLFGKKEEKINSDEFNKIASEIDEEIQKKDNSDKQNNAELKEFPAETADYQQKEDDKTSKSLFGKKTSPFKKENKKEIPSEQKISKPESAMVDFSGADVDSDEAKLLDEKIRGTKTDSDGDGQENIAQIKAQQLAQKHMKTEPRNHDAKDSDVLESFEKKKRSNSEGFADLKVDNDSEEEHVFFDEGEELSDDSDYVGWSPTVPEDEKEHLKAKTKENKGLQQFRPKVKTPEVQPDLRAQMDNMREVGGDVELPRDALQVNSVALSDLGFSEEEWEELDFYKLYEPFAYVELLRERDSMEKCYFLVEVDLTDEEREVMDFILETLTRTSFETSELESKRSDEYLYEKLEEVIDEYDVNITIESKNKIFYYIGKDALGLGKIDPLLRDPNIEDISCDGAGVPVFLYHRTYGSLKSNVVFDTEDDLSAFVHKLAQKCGKHVSIADPMLDATMPDGSRVQLTLSDEITAKGSTFTIRKFREDPFSPPDLVEFNTMSPEMIAYMWIAVENGINALFAGGTASGKTTALNAMSLFIPVESKIVSIEETREINLPHPNWIPGVARAGFGDSVDNRSVGQIDMYDLMKAALRQRPEYILVGEIRGKEAYVLFQAMATGHATYSTVHADSAQSLIHRLEGKPINIPRVMLQSLDIVLLHVITRVKNKRARRCKKIIEIIDIDPSTKEILTNEVFRWDPVEDKFEYSGKSYVLERIRAEKDMNREKMTHEIKNRTALVEWMNERNVRDFTSVSRLIAEYNENPDKTIDRIKNESVISQKTQ